MHSADIETSLWNLTHGNRRYLDGLMLDSMIRHTREALGE